MLNQQSFPTLGLSLISVYSGFGLDRIRLFRIRFRQNSFIQDSVQTGFGLDRIRLFMIRFRQDSVYSGFGLDRIRFIQDSVQTGFGLDRIRFIQDSVQTGFTVLLLCYFSMNSLYFSCMRINTYICIYLSVLYMCVFNATLNNISVMSQ